MLLNVADIANNPYQPRKNFDVKKLQELAESIRLSGVLQPIIVRRSKILGYELLAGERRLRAVKLLGQKNIPAIIRDYSDQEMMLLSIIENLQRDDMNPLDEARSIEKILAKTSIKHDEIAQLLGKSRSYVSNLLRILKLPNEILRLLQDNKISAAHARTLLAEPDNLRQIDLAHKILSEKLSVRELEKRIYHQDKKEKIGKKTNIYIEESEKMIAKRTGNRVKIVANQNFKGKVELSFNSLDELEKLIHQLTETSTDDLSKN